MPSLVSRLFGEKKVLFRDTLRPVTPFGGLGVFIEFLARIGYAQVVEQHLPFRLDSPNAIPPAHTLTAYLVAVLAGARRFAHTSLLRADHALHALLGIERFPGDDTIRGFFRRFGMAQIEAFWRPLWQWQLARLPAPAQGFWLDLDSTVFERYGRQQGAKKGYNPRKPGRPSHHPLLAVLAEAPFVLHGWLRSGNCAAARGVVAFLEEALSLLRTEQTLRGVRADAGFFDQELLGFLEARQLHYIVVAKLTVRLKRMAAAIQDWTPLDAFYAVGEFRAQLLGWDRDRRFVVVRELVREDKAAVGRRLLEVPGYTFRIFVTNSAAEPLAIWRDYNGRATVEQRISELKTDLAADDFCLQEFFATEAAFRAVLWLFNLLSEFQRAGQFGQYRQPATLRMTVFLCGAILGRSGQRLVLHLSCSWGGWQQRKPLWERLLRWPEPTSPKLKAALSPSG